MADKPEKKSLKKRRGKKGQSEEEKLTKDETEVAKHLRWNLKTKKSVMYGDEVFYFTGSKIVDLMLDSKWASGKAKKSSVKFTDRDSTYFLLDKMIMLGLFSRVHRIYKEKEKKGKDKKEDKKKVKEEKDKVDAKTSEIEQSPKKEKKDGASKEGKDGKEGKKKKKVKVTLEPHELNVFVDSDDAVFIWIYDPVHPSSFFKGILLVLATIALCLFPLWPENFRLYSWYLSVLAMVFIGAILFLAIFRYVIFGFMWAVTLGKVHFWLLPNLTADCGFFESFVPIYEFTAPSNADQGSEDKVQDNSEIRNEEDNKAEPEEAGCKLSDKESSNIEKTKAQDTVKGDGSGENNSGSNKDNDESETWVKVTKSDAENESNTIDKNDKTIC